MSRALSLACLSVLNLTPAQMIVAAARCGYDSIGTRFLPAAPGGIAYPLMSDAKLMRETKAAMADTGVGIYDLEIIRINDSFDAKAYRGFLDAGAELGAKAVLIAGDDPDRARFSANYAAFCQEAAPYDMTCDLEFMPWTHIPNLSAAKQVVAAVACSNAGILVDALHFARSDSRVEELDDIPRHWLHYAQLCDAPGEIPPDTAGLIHTARCERLLPGEGGIKLAELFRHLPADLPISLEIPNEPREPVIGGEAWARCIMAAAKGFLAGMG